VSLNYTPPMPSQLSQLSLSITHKLFFHGCYTSSDLLRVRNAVTIACSVSITASTISRRILDCLRRRLSSDSNLYWILTPHTQSSLSPSPSPSHIATDGQSVSKSWCRAPSRAHDQIFFFFFLIWNFLSCSIGAPWDPLSLIFIYFNPRWIVFLLLI
jgi:hypothetical protein